MTPDASIAITSANEDKAINDSTEADDDFPNLFWEATTMTVDCIIVFILADLRELARSELLNDSDNRDVLNLPIRADSIPRIWQNNKDVLRRKIRADEYDTLQYLVDRYIIDHVEDDELVAAECHFVGDEKASSECVYAIYSNSLRKRLTVAFRGSITLKDWLQDAKSAFSDVRNPLYGVGGFEIDHQPEMLGLHMGFSDYLYGDSSPLAIPLPELKDLPKPLTLSKPTIPKEENSGTVRDDSSARNARNARNEEEEAVDDGRNNDLMKKKTKIQTILDQVSSLYETRPDYKLYLTVSILVFFYISL